MASIAVGLVGIGYIADFHCNAARAVDGAVVRAVCDTNRARAERFAKAKGIEGVYADVASMVKSEKLDVVHILTPPNVHESPTRDALEAGVDAFVEKPLCHTTVAARGLRELATARGRTIGTAHNFLFVPAYERLRRDVLEGRLGRIDQIEIVWNKSLGQLRGGPFGAWMLAEPRNILFEIGAHSFAHALDLADTPDRVRTDARDRITLPRGLEFYRRWEIRAEGRADVRIRLSFIDAFTEHYVHVRGSQAAARVDFENDTYSLWEHGTQPVDVDRFLAVASVATENVVQAARTLSDFVLTKLGASKVGGPYQRGITRAAEAFYAGRGGTLDDRVSPELGERVVAFAERAAAAANLPESPRAPRTTTPGPRAVAPKSDVLVLGGTGFIGRALVRHLRKHDFGVRLLARDPSGVPPELLDLGIEVQRGDLTDRRSLETALDGIRFVQHLARGSGNTWAEYEKSDVDPTRAFAELAIDRRIERFVYTSSIAFYDAGRHAGTITEDTKPGLVQDPYARSKFENESNLLELHRTRALPLIILRPGIVLGLGGNPLHWGVAGWPAPSVARLWGDGNSMLPIVLVDDCADGMVRALKAEGVIGRSYNLVGPPILTANEYLDELERRAGISLRRIPTSSERYYAEAMAKWVVKAIGRDPNARRPRFADWDGRTCTARFDGSRAERELSWTPTRDRDVLIREGIYAPVDEHFELSVGAVAPEHTGRANAPTPP